ncbi:alpha/beta hydrolase [uncultured Flavobacterium sp.]|uniref:alpha/beta hydrolase n=1 Tax=uncultured Flavobacterium sp. TaxID=165435 RepID=UPI0025DC9BF0|nr:alpha/beta hydrolase [uncultured Flavobacterium sp.]
MKIFFLLISFLGFTFANAQQTYPLYENKIPNSKPTADKEKSVNNGILIISEVSVPTITVYQPKKQNKSKSAVIICPGGGYGILAAGHEGSDVAQALNKIGVTAFVLKYRLPNDEIMEDKTIGPLQDAQRALQMVRERAKEWKIDSAKIGIMGFSAGGHLAASASTLFNRSLIDNKLKTSLRPDFSILIYPVISFSDSLTHLGSRENLAGKNPSKEIKKLYSCEMQVTPNTPKAFIVHASDDADVSVKNSLAYYQALLKNGIYCEMLLYPHGGHGFGMDNKTTLDKWMDNLKNWMLANDWL